MTVTVIIQRRTGLVYSKTAAFNWEAIVQWHDGEEAHKRRLFAIDKSDAEAQAQALEKQLKEDMDII